MTRGLLVVLFLAVLGAAVWLRAPVADVGRVGVGWTAAEIADALECQGDAVGGCGRCRRSWREASTPEPVHVQIGPEKGVFALCRECWDALTPEERIPYHLAVVDAWACWGEEFGIKPEERAELVKNILGGVVE